MTGGLLQLVTSGQQDIYLTINPEITFFKKAYSRHTNFSTEIIQIFPDQQAEYDQEITFILNNKGDGIFRCYIEIDLPILAFSDNTIDNSVYSNNKSIQIGTIQNTSNKYQNLYNNLKYFVDIEVILYRKLKSLNNINNVTISTLKDATLQFNNQYKNQKNQYNIDNNVFLLIDISGYITNISQMIGTDDTNTIITIKTINSNLDKLYNNMIQNLQYYHSNWKKNLNIYNQLIQETNNINFNWAEYLGHNFFEYFRLDIGGIEITSYTNDYLHINQTHAIKEEHSANYFKMIGHDPKLNTFNSLSKGGNKIIVPLLFYFCKDAGSTLPLIALQYQTVMITAKINKIKKLICFEHWEKMYNDLLIVQNSYTGNNINLNTNLIYSKYNIDTANKIITYYCTTINRELLKQQFSTLLENEISLILTYGSNNIISSIQWNYLMTQMHNLKTPNFISIFNKIGSYYYYADFNLLYNQIIQNNPLNISLLGEFVYFDDVERYKFANSKLEYIIENINDNSYDINNTLSYSCEFTFSKPCKELFWYVQPNIFTIGLSEYGQNKDLLFNYENYFNSDIISSQSFKLEQLEILLPNINDNYYFYCLPYKYLNNNQPKGIYYHTFSLYPEETQPSGTANLSIIKGKQYNIIFNNGFLNEYFNNSASTNINPNGYNMLLRFFAKTYNMFVIHKGQSMLLFTL
jgi:hypothetical protein